MEGNEEAPLPDTALGSGRRKRPWIWSLSQEYRGRDWQSQEMRLKGPARAQMAKSGKEYR